MLEIRDAEDDKRDEDIKLLCGEFERHSREENPEEKSSLQGIDPVW